MTFSEILAPINADFNLLEASNMLLDFADSSPTV